MNGQFCQALKSRLAKPPKYLHYCKTYPRVQVYVRDDDGVESTISRHARR